MLPVSAVSEPGTQPWSNGSGNPERWWRFALSPLSCPAQLLEMGEVEICHLVSFSFGSLFHLIWGANEGNYKKCDLQIIQNTDAELPIFFKYRFYIIGKTSKTLEKGDNFERICQNLCPVTVQWQSCKKIYQLIHPGHIKLIRKCFPNIDWDNTSKPFSRVAMHTGIARRKNSLINHKLGE